MLIWSCNGVDEIQQEEIDPEELSEVNEILSIENVLAEEISLLDVANTNIIGSLPESRARELCAELSVDSVNFVIVIDFGDGCIGPYGRSRSGKIISTYSGGFNDGQTNREITFEDYFVNNQQITGSIELGKSNLTDEGTFISTRTLIDYTIIYPNGTSKTTNGSTEREIIEGFGDYDISNNVTLVTGGFTTVTTSGVTHIYTIINPVRLSYECWLSGGMLRTEGLVEIERSSDLRVRTKIVDYGEDCDNQYSITIDNELIIVEE